VFSVHYSVFSIRCSKFQKQNNDSSRNFDTYVKTVQTPSDKPLTSNCASVIQYFPRKFVHFKYIFQLTQSDKCHSPSCIHFPSCVTHIWNSFAACFSSFGENTRLVTDIENHFYVRMKKDLILAFHVY
jgi:hypothetical protein